MRFISNLRPLLTTASSSPPHFSRTLSILGAGGEGQLNFDDLELKNTFSGARCAKHTITMNSLMTEQFASRDPGTTFIHSYPSVVKTGIDRELPRWLKIVLKLASPILSFFYVSAEETGARQLFIATSGVYTPAKPAENAAFASGVPPPNGLGVMKGSNGKVGSGGYVVSWNGDINGKKIVEEYNAKGVGKTVWEWTMGIFERVEKLDKGKAPASTS
jgi:hypothetical protein